MRLIRRSTRGLWLSGLPLAALLALAMPLAGCAGDAVPPEPRLPQDAESPQRAEVVADWDDVQAAVTVALNRTELVKVSAQGPTADSFEVRLRSSLDEPGLLTVRRAAPPGQPDPVPITLTARVGRFGDPPRERQFLDLIVRRLGQLRGVETAPLED